MAGARLQLQLPADRGQALAHIAQADALLGMGLHGVGIEAPAVVEHPQQHAALGMKLQRQDDLRGGRMLGPVGQRLLGDAEQHRVQQLGQLARQALQLPTDLGRPGLVELARQMRQRGRQAQGVQQGRTQAVRKAAHLGQAGVEPLQRARQGLHIAGLLGAFDQQLGRDQGLADAVMQLAREVGALVLLRAHHLVRQRAQLGLGQALLAEVQGQATDADQGHAEDGDAGDPPHGLGDIALRLGVELVQRGLDAVQVQARAHHPAPALHRHHIAELGHHLIAGGLAPEIVHIAAAGACLRDQLLDGRPALRVAQPPEVLPQQLGLARVHQHPAFEVVDEEVAILAVVQRGQQAQGLLLVGGVIPRPAITFTRGGVAHVLCVD
eukprot:Opistho-2@96324